MTKKANKPRREAIYPHRSFRHLRFDPLATFVAFALATLLSFAVVSEAGTLADLHQRLTAWFTQLAGVNGEAAVGVAAVFPGVLAAEVPPVAIPGSGSVGDMLRIPALAAAVALLYFSRRNTITRGSSTSC